MRWSEPPSAARRHWPATPEPPTQNSTGREARPSARPIALVLGNEERGLAASVAAACERRVMIPGGGAVESLNVAAAAAILIHHFFGRRGPAPAWPSRFNSGS